MRSQINLTDVMCFVDSVEEAVATWKQLGFVIVNEDGEGYSKLEDPTTKQTIVFASGDMGHKTVLSLATKDLASAVQRLVANKFILLSENRVEGGMSTAILKDPQGVPVVVYTED